jgi:hypothetical protein
MLAGQGIAASFTGRILTYSSGKWERTILFVSPDYQRQFAISHSRAGFQQNSMPFVPSILHVGIQYP